jgi:hypothetical protein
MTIDYADLKGQAETALRAARAAPAALDAQIAAYPTQISGCDAQFNHWRVNRRRLSDALTALGADVFIATPRPPFRNAGIESR